MASQITSLAVVCSSIYSGADQRKHRVTGLCEVTGELSAQRASDADMFPFDDVIMILPMLGDQVQIFAAYSVLGDCDNIYFSMFHNAMPKNAKGYFISTCDV